MTTLVEIKRQTLEMMGRLRLGQDFQTQDNDAMQEAYDQVYAELKELGLNTWVTAGPIPDEVSVHVQRLMLLNKADSYGISEARYNRIVSKAGPNGELAKREIKLLTTPRYESLDEPDDY